MDRATALPLMSACAAQGGPVAMPPVCNLLSHCWPACTHAVKMVTGDQLLIGKETARQLGMGTDMYKIEALLHVSPGSACLGISCQL